MSEMFGGMVIEVETDKYGFLTCDHSASSYGLPVFVPLDSHTRRPNGDAARGPGEVGLLVSVGWAGFLGRQTAGDVFGEYTGWSEALRDACLRAGWKFAS